MVLFAVANAGLESLFGGNGGGGNGGGGGGNGGFDIGSLLRSKFGGSGGGNSGSNSASVVKVNKIVYFYLNLHASNETKLYLLRISFFCSNINRKNLPY